MWLYLVDRLAQEQRLAPLWKFLNWIHLIPHEDEYILSKGKTHLQKNICPFVLSSTDLVESLSFLFPECSPIQYATQKSSLKAFYGIQSVTNDSL